MPRLTDGLTSSSSPVSSRRTPRPAARIISTTLAMPAVPCCGIKSLLTSVRSSETVRRSSARASRPGAGDVAERLLGQRGIGIDRIRRAVRLDDHHADRVGDDIVEFAGDSGSFRGHRILGTPIPFVFGHFESGGHFLVVGRGGALKNSAVIQGQVHRAASR